MIGKHLAVGGVQKRCLFGAGHVSLARWISSSWVECVVPGQMAGNVTVELELEGGGGVSSNGLRYEYAGRSSLYATWPSSGPVVGGTAVSMIGSWYTGASGVQRCRFGSTAVAATQVSSSVILCKSPPMNDAGIVEVVVGDGREVRGAGLGVDFFYRRPLQVRGLRPSAGPMDGSSLVLVDVHELGGDALGVDAEVHCLFASRQGRSVSVGRMANEGSAACATPAAAEGTVMSVELSTNGGVDFSESGVSYIFEQTPT
eukprot:3940103-Rhodomonas_salina.1